MLFFNTASACQGAGDNASGRPRRRPHSPPSCSTAPRLRTWPFMARCAVHAEGGGRQLGDPGQQPPSRKTRSAAPDPQRSSSSAPARAGYAARRHRMRSFPRPRARTIAGCWVGLDPPADLFAVATLFIIIVLLHYSTVLSQLDDQSTVLAQRVALLKLSSRAWTGVARQARSRHRRASGCRLFCRPVSRLGADARVHQGCDR